MSLRDQLLAAGLVSQKQVRDAERQQQHQQRGQNHAHQRQRAPQESSQKQGPPSVLDRASGKTVQDRSTAATPGMLPGNVGPSARGAIPSAFARQSAAQSAKVARDLALNKKRQEKAEKKARAAQIKQLIEQNRVPRDANDERYNFVDGGRVRFIAANADVRRRLISGELCIVRHDAGHEVVSAAVAQRIRERDERAVIQPGTASAAPAIDASIEDPYKDFAVPDDLIW